MRFYALIICSLVFAAGCSSSPKKAAEAPPAETKAAPAKPAENTTSSNVVQCTHKDEKRTMEVKKKGKGCELSYTKSGAESVVATAVNGTAHCEKVLGRMRENLKNSGYTCE